MRILARPQVRVEFGGQAHNPMPADGYHRFVELLHAEGIAAADFRVMCRDNGDDLLHG